MGWQHALSKFVLQAVNINIFLMSMIIFDEFHLLCPCLHFFPVDSAPWLLNFKRIEKLLVLSTVDSE